MKRILFIGHDAGRTGAPLVLLHLLEWLREREPSFKIDLLLLRGGELAERYAERVDTLSIQKIKERTFLARQVERVSRLIGVAESAEPKVLQGEYDIVVGNTVAALAHLEVYKRHGHKTICWLHELDHIIKSFYPIEHFVRLAGSVDHFVCASEAVKQMLERFGVRSPASVVYEFSPVVPPANIDASVVKGGLGIPPGSFVVAGGGTVQWRKGTDLFLQIADRVLKSGRPVHFVWIGGRSAETENDFAQVEFDLLKMGLLGKVTFTGVVPDPEKYLAAADLFALTSREDPFPLFCMEAATLGKPIICFERSGGMPEFVNGDAGAVVPYGDVFAFAETITAFFDDRESLRKAGESALEKVSTEFAPDRSLHAMRSILDAVAAGEKPL